MSNDVDSVLYRFLIDQEIDQRLILNVVFGFQNLKSAVELNIPSKFDLDILRCLESYKYEDPIGIMFDDVRAINKIKNEILELYAKRK